MLCSSKVSDWPNIQYDVTEKPEETFWPTQYLVKVSLLVFS